MKYLYDNRVRLTFLASSILYFLSGILLILVPFALSLPETEINYGLVSRLAGGVLLGLLGVGAQLIGNKESLEGKLEAAKTGPSVRFVGSGEQAVLELSRKVRNARNVSNTFIGIRDASSEKAAGLYGSWITNNDAGEWVDIVGPAQAFDERYGLVKVSPDKIVGHHTLYIIRHSTPIINFIILDYPNDALTKDGDNSEVYFGWISSEKDSQRIFCSSDHVVVNTFRNYFRALKAHRMWGEPIQIDYRAKEHTGRVPRSDLVDKVGTWLTLSVTEQDVATYGFFTVGVTKSQTEAKKAGVLEIVGVLLDDHLAFFDPIDHHEKNISHYQNKIFIEYGDAPDVDRKGFCFYEFQRFRPRGQNNAIESVSGFFIDEGHWKRNLIFGRKASFSGDPSDPAVRGKMAMEALDFALLSERISSDVYERAKAKLSTPRSPNPRARGAHE